MKIDSIIKNRIQLIVEFVVGVKSYFNYDVKLVLSISDNVIGSVVCKFNGEKMQNVSVNMMNAAIGAIGAQYRA